MLALDGPVPPGVNATTLGGDFALAGFASEVYRQTTEDLIRCLENSFWHFGGVPKVLVPDNLKAGVQIPDWFDPELPKLRAFAQHYHLAILPVDSLPCKPCPAPVICLNSFFVDNQLSTFTINIWRVARRTNWDE
jgi:hypothetical protein